jgi:hypothetical protein
MRTLRHRGKLLLLAPAATVLALFIAVLALRPYLEGAIRARIEAKAVQRGLTVHIDALRVGFWPPLRLTGLTLEKGSFRLNVDTLEAWWRGRTRLVVKKAALLAPAGLSIAAESTAWDVRGAAGDDFALALVEPQTGLVLSRASAHDEVRWTVEAKDLPMGRLLDVRRYDQPLLDGGTILGALTLKTSKEGDRFDLDLAAHSARLPALTGSESKALALGGPTEAAVKIAGFWKPSEGSLGIPRWSADVDGAALSGSLVVRNLDTDALVDLSLEVERVDFARLLRTWGLESPVGPGRLTTVGKADDLGSAKLAAQARGTISDPASFVVTQKLEYTPPKPLPDAIVKLRGDFIQEVVQDSGEVRKIQVSPSSPDFIPLADVPPLFLRALLIAEDAGFYGHRGIDLREMPAALITDWARGGAARGASTITQQLAKNLFLSHEKHLGRKLQELALTLLLESALDKRRILEIYLNVIEWGPGLYGLRPAARAYFDEQPGELTPAQMAFLVTIIPGPLKYQSSFAHGTPGPGLRKLIDTLLAKLLSVNALSDEEYASALDEEIVIQGREAPTPENQPAEEPAKSE